MSKMQKIKPKAAVTLMPTTWDSGAAGLANRRDLVEEPASEFDPNTGRETRNPNGIKRQRRKTMIRIYSSGQNPGLSQTQEAAAYRLYACAQGNPDRDPLAAIGEIPTSGGDPMVSAIDKRREFLAMWKLIPASSRPVVERVVLDDLPIWDGNSAQRERHMVRLRAGLDAIS